MEFQREGCNFFFEENEFFGRVATRGFSFILSLNVICTKYLPDLEQLLLGRFYEINSILVCALR